MKKLLACVLLVLALAATSCATSFDRGGAIDDLVEEGIPRDQATCVIDGTIDEFGEAKLASDDEPTDEEQSKMLDIMSGCLFPAGG